VRPHLQNNQSNKREKEKKQNNWNNRKKKKRSKKGWGHGSWGLSSNPSTAKRKRKKSQAPEAHTCNPSYSEGRDQEDPDLKPAQTNSS
jgi:hypothetical protein